MYPVSQAFKTAVRQSHKVVTRAEVWKGDQKLRELDVASGSVEVDARRSVRRTCQISVVSPLPEIDLVPVYMTYGDMNVEYVGQTYADIEGASYSEIIFVVVRYDRIVSGDSLVPADAWDVLAPLGNELRLWRGIEFEDGSQELVPLGVFGINDVEVQEDGNGLVINIVGTDRSLKVARASWTSAVRIAEGTNVADAIASILTDRYDDVETSFASTTSSTGNVVLGTESQNSPWADAQRLAEAAGMDLFFDGSGVAVLQPVRDYENATPDAVYRENDEAMIVALRRRFSNEETYNGVIVVAENTTNDSVIRVETWDDDPTSPTYRYGTLGQIPFFYFSPLITTTEQATAAGIARLSKIKGVVEIVDWIQIADPSLDVADVIAVYNTNSKLERLMVLDKLTIPLDPSQPMTAVARTVRSLTGESFLEEDANV